MRRISIDVLVVELGGSGAVAIVEQERDFGDFAGGAFGGAGEDEVVHLAAAHGAGGGGAHGPAQRFEQVGLAAAIGADNAGQALFDRHIHRIDEGLEARDLEADQVHACSQLAQKEPRKGGVLARLGGAGWWVNRFRFPRENAYLAGAAAAASMAADRASSVFSSTSLPLTMKDGVE